MEGNGIIDLSNLKARKKQQSLKINMQSCRKAKQSLCVTQCLHLKPIMHFNLMLKWKSSWLGNILT